MNITINKSEGKLIVALCGDLDNAASTQAERGLAPAFDCTDCDIIIDCTELSYISSSGLRILLNIFKHTRSNGKKAILKGLKEDVKEVFKLCGFLQLFVVED